MATDYDTPRKTDDDLAEDSLEEIKARRTKATIGLVDLGEGESGPIQLPGADLSEEDLAVWVLPRQADEFTCTRCFLVQHRSRLARHAHHDPVCQECA